MGISDFTKRNIEKHRKKTENLGISMDFHGITDGQMSQMVIWMVIEMG